jgi:hypothetical protein
MKRLFLGLLTIVLFIGCTNTPIENNESKERIEWLPEPDKQERLKYEAIEKLQKKNCDFLNPDTSLCGIILRDSESATMVIGTENKTDDHQQYHFYSNFERETLTLTQHPGDGKNQISIFSVSYSDKASHGYKQLNIDTFKTEKGIKLGMSKQQVIAILGNCYETIDSTEDFVSLYYRIEMPKDSKSKLLQTNNMPIYYATYGFSNDKLEGYEFGFENP